MDEGKFEEIAAVPPWTFLSNYAHVLLLIAKDPKVKLRDVASRIGITERAVQRIVSDLVEARYLERERNGRRNHYKVHPDLPMRHPVVAHQDVGALIELIMPARNGQGRTLRMPSGSLGGGKPRQTRPCAEAGHNSDLASA